MQFSTICDEFGMFVMSFDPFLGVGGRFVVLGDDLEDVWGNSIHYRKLLENCGPI